VNAAFARPNYYNNIASESLIPWCGRSVQWKRDSRREILMSGF